MSLCELTDVLTALLFYVFLFSSMLGLVAMAVLEEYRKMSCQEKNGELCEYCRATDFLSPTSATPTPRPYPDYSKLPDFHYLPGTKTPTTGCKPDDYQPRAQINRCFKRVRSNRG